MCGSGRLPALTEAQAAALGARALRSLVRELGGEARARRAARGEGLLPLVELATPDAPGSRDALGAGTGRTGGEPPAGPGRRPGRLREIMGALARENAAAVSRALAGADVPHAFTKGVATAPRYGTPSLRPMSDVDVLVRPGDLERVREVVPALGYAQATSSEVEAVFVAPGPSVLASTLDVHTRLGYVGQYEFPVEKMLARAVVLAGLPVLAAEDEILALAAQAARHRMRAVGRSMCDIAVITLTSRIDWDAVTGRARAWGLAVATWAALTCARRAFGAAVPLRVTERLRPSAHQETWLRLWLDLGRVSPYRLARRRYGPLHRRAALVALWPALSDGLLAGTCFAARYSARMLVRALAGG